MVNRKVFKRKAELETLIESIGFKKNMYNTFEYKIFRIFILNTYYQFYNGSFVITYGCNDLTPIYNNFKRELRSIKIKQLLGGPGLISKI